MGLLDKWLGSKSVAASIAPQTLDIAALLKQADACIDRGEFAQAAQALASVKGQEPQRVAARVNYAFCLLNLGQSAQAKAELEACVSLAPKNVDALYMLSGLLIEAQSWAQASEHLQTVIQLQPGFLLAYPDLARTLCELQKFDDALSICERALSLNGGDVHLMLTQGNVFFAMHKFTQALACFDQVLVRQPGQPEVAHNKALVLEKLNREQEALVFAKHAVEAAQDNPAYIANYARMLASNGQSEEGRRLLEQALKRFANNSDLLKCAAIYDEQAGRHEQALAGLDRVLVGDAKNASALEQKAFVFLAMRSYGACVEAAQRALDLAPNLASAWNVMGMALTRSNRLEDAQDALEKALSIKPDFVDAISNLAALHKERGEIEAAIRSYDEVIKFNPVHVGAHSNRLFCLAYKEGASAKAYIDLARQSDQLLHEGLKPFDSWKTGVAAGAYAGKLRIGLVSGDLMKHPVGYFLESTLKHLDPQRFELLAYPTISFEDDFTRRVKPFFKTWRPLTGMNDLSAAQAIHADGIHILVDLAGWSAGHRLAVFAHKPAPVQATWLGFFASTGMRSMDYILVDPHGVDPSEQDFYSEKLCYLPETRLSFSPPSSKPATPLPALSNGCVTLGCFQDWTKVNNHVLGCWLRIMTALPSTRLRLMSKQCFDPILRENMRARLSNMGFEMQRVVIQEAMGYEAYLDSYAQVDFMLDTFPYPGGTTTCEALWMGVPTVTLEGNTMLARQGAGLMKSANLPSWVAKSEEQYVDLAIAKANDLSGLAHLRASIRGQIAQTSLFNGERFSAQLGSAFEAMWRGEV
jgi:protein O-GlcNAc transferase